MTASGSAVSGTDFDTAGTEATAAVAGAGTAEAGATDAGDIGWEGCWSWLWLWGWGCWNEPGWL